MIKVWGSADSVEELLKKGLGKQEITVNGKEGPESAARYDLFIDLDFDVGGSAALEWLPRIGPKPVLLNTVCTTLVEIPSGETLVFGFNSWPTFINRGIAEVTASGTGNLPSLNKVMDLLGWEYALVEDRLGMVTPRIVSMIINEACFTLGEGSASREDIDKAMKLGTRHPYGPFEWLDRIGPLRVCRLLEKLHGCTGDDRYLVAPLLKNESLFKTVSCNWIT